MDLQELIATLLTPATQVALIIAIVEVIKGLGFPTKYLPIIDLVLGILSGVLVYGLMLNVGIGYGLILGIALGLSACGLFSGIKNLKNN